MANKLTPAQALEKWIEALLSGKYKQVAGYLQKQKKNADGKRESLFCCLGIACELYREYEGDRLKIDVPQDDDFVYESEMSEGQPCSYAVEDENGKCQWNDQGLPAEVSEWLGFPALRRAVYRENQPQVPNDGMHRVLVKVADMLGGDINRAYPEDRFDAEGKQDKDGAYAYVSLDGLNDGAYRFICTEPDVEGQTLNRAYTFAEIAAFLKQAPKGLFADEVQPQS